MLRLTNFKLRGMDADSEAADPGIQVIAGYGALMPFG